MPLPTLLIKGRLRPATEDPIAKAKLDDWVPMDYIMEWFRTRLGQTGAENRVLILKSETASGKSTAFPPVLYNTLVRDKSAAGIICTQPRVATTIENVVEMLKYPANKLTLGQNIGWSTKFDKARPAKAAGLLSATIGTLTQQLRVMTDEQVMEKYRYILIDETHERDLQTDMTIYMLKNLLKRNATNPKCPFVVLMSATFDPYPFLKYFGVNINNNFIWCSGQTAFIDEKWDWNGERIVNDFARATATIVNQIVTVGYDDDISKADILIFMPGKAEFKTTHAQLTKLNEKLADEGKKVFTILQIDGPAFQTQNEDFMKTVRVPTSDQKVTISGVEYKPSRRVIISTNVAETGLTLDNLKYILDAGFNREIEFNPILGIRALMTKPAPQSRIRQRRGRVGRKFDGVFYPLYPKYIYDKLPTQQFPQILIEDISPIILDVINEQLKSKRLSGNSNPTFKISDIDMLDIPSPDALASAIEKLYTLGFVSQVSPRWGDPDGDKMQQFGLTKLGVAATAFSMLPLESIRMILAAYSWGVSILDIITIAAYLAIDSKTLVDAGPVPLPGQPAVKTNLGWSAIYKVGAPEFLRGNYSKARVLIGDDFIEGIILFNAIKTKMGIEDFRKWCQKNYLSYKACLAFIKTRDDIIEQMLVAKFELFTHVDTLIGSNESNFMNTVTKIKYCIYDGYRNNLLLKLSDEYRTLTGLRVVPPKLFSDDSKTDEALRELHPKFVIFRELSLKLNKKTSIYDVLADKVSILDGYISIDPAFGI